MKYLNKHYFDRWPTTASRQGLRFRKDHASHLSHWDLGNNRAQVPLAAYQNAVAPAGGMDLRCLVSRGSLPCLRYIWLPAGDLRNAQLILSLHFYSCGAT